MIRNTTIFPRPATASYKPGFQPVFAPSEDRFASFGFQVVRPLYKPDVTARTAFFSLSVFQAEQFSGVGFQVVRTQLTTIKTPAHGFFRDVAYAAVYPSVKFLTTNKLKAESGKTPSGYFRVVIAAQPPANVFPFMTSPVLRPSEGVMASAFFPLVIRQEEAAAGFQQVPFSVTSAVREAPRFVRPFSTFVVTLDAPIIAVSRFSSSSERHDDADAERDDVADSGTKR